MPLYPQCDKVFVHLLSRLNPSRTAYDTDLTEAEWKQLEPLVPPAKAGGRPPRHSRRQILNAIFYAVRSGSAGKLLPHDLPPWRTVYHYFWSWRRTGIGQRIHDRLRERVREAAGRNPNPSAAILDSQSVRTREAGGGRGFDAGKKIRGRKRHILVDTLGLLLLVVVTAANVQDRNGAQLLLSSLAKQFRASAAHLGRWRLRRRTGILDPRFTEVGEGAVGNCSETERTERLLGFTLALAGRTHFCLALPEPAAPVRRRAMTADDGVPALHRDDPPHDAPLGCLVKLFKLALTEPTSRPVSYGRVWV